MSGPRRRAAGGFTLLEAMVALVIFTLGALALYDWQASNLRTLARLSEHAEREQLGHEALALVQGINPTAEPRGERRLGQRLVRWESDPVEPTRTGRTTAGYPGLFDLDLFVLDVRVIEAGRERLRFQVRQVGYRQARQLDLE